MPPTPPNAAAPFLRLVSVQLTMTVTDDNHERAELASPAHAQNNLTPDQWLQWLDAEYKRLREKFEAHFRHMAERAADYQRIGIEDNEYGALAKAMGIV